MQSIAHMVPAGISTSAFIVMLQKHDWYYSYSDCNRTWRAGKAKEEEIDKILEKGGQVYKDLYNEHKPKSFSRV